MDQGKIIKPDGQPAAPVDEPSISVRFRNGQPELTVRAGTTPSEMLVAGALMTRVGFRLLDAAEARAYAERQEVAAVAADLQRNGRN